MRRWKYEKDGEWIELDEFRSKLLSAAMAMMDTVEMTPKPLPTHHPACSNQNVLDPLGKYKGVHECGCRRAFDD